MSEITSKKFRKKFNKEFKQQLQETAEKLCEAKFSKMMEAKDKEIFYIARQRDWIFIISILLLISNITFMIMLQWKNIKLLFKIFNL